MKLTQEQLAELIAKVFANLDEKRKAISEGGESSPISFGTDEILSEISAILEGMEGSEPPVGEPMNEPVGEGEGDLKGEGEGGSPVSPEFIAKVIAALNGVKTAEGAGENNAPAAAPATEQKAAPARSGEQKTAPAAQRKYANLFLSTGASRDGGQVSGFKARMAAMSAPERRKAAYGMFGRAVKCIHASGGDVERAAFTAERKFGDAEMAREFKALSATSPAEGGYLVPEVYANEIIELLPRDCYLQPRRSSARHGERQPEHPQNQDRLSRSVHR